MQGLQAGCVHWETRFLALPGDLELEEVDTQGERGLGRGRPAKGRAASCQVCRGSWRIQVFLEAMWAVELGK